MQCVRNFISASSISRVYPHQASLAFIKMKWSGSGLYPFAWGRGHWTFDAGLFSVANPILGRVNFEKLSRGPQQHFQAVYGQKESSGTDERSEKPNGKTD
jgi:hypothetical protein